jgi:hypothetical protein
MEVKKEQMKNQNVMKFRLFLAAKHVSPRIVTKCALPRKQLECTPARANTSKTNKEEKEG